LRIGTFSRAQFSENHFCETTSPLFLRHTLLDIWSGWGVNRAQGHPLPPSAASRLPPVTKEGGRLKSGDDGGSSHARTHDASTQLSNGGVVINRCGRRYANYMPMNAIVEGDNCGAAFMATERGPLFRQGRLDLSSGVRRSNPMNGAIAGVMVCSPERQDSFIQRIIRIVRKRASPLPRWKSPPKVFKGA